MDMEIYIEFDLFSMVENKCGSLCIKLCIQFKIICIALFTISLQTTSQEIKFLKYIYIVETQHS